ncbi:MAG: FtsX-like permease family protein [Gammaproteobacteria bacterium]
MLTFIRRQKYLIDYTLSSLLRRKTKNLGLLLVYTLIVFLLASVMLYTHALQREAGIILAESPELIVQRMVAGRHDLVPAEYLEALRGIRGVRAAQGRLWGYYYDPVVKANYTLLVPADRALQRGEIVVGAGVARTHNMGRGDYLTLRAADGKAMPLRVADVLHHESELVSADLILLGEADYREFFRIDAGLYTDLALQVRNPREVRTIAEKVTRLFPDTRPILREEILRTYDSIFNWRQGIVVVLLSGAILAFAIFAWDKASGLSAEEKREIGILKAIGWETSDVIRMKFWEGAVISLSAFLGGYLLAYLHVFYGAAMLFEPVLKGWAVLYPAFRPVPFIDGLQVATLFFLTVFPYTAATIVPVWRAAIMDPDAVMR